VTTSQTDYLARTNNGQTFVGGDVRIYQALLLASALNLYAKTGIRVNKSYTPTAMLRVANKLTGHNYRRGQYAAAATALRELADRMKAAPRVETEA
jgi:hypothetical protein